VCSKTCRKSYSWNSMTWWRFVLLLICLPFIHKIVWSARKFPPLSSATIFSPWLLSFASFHTNQSLPLKFKILSSPSTVRNALDTSDMSSMCLTILKQMSIKEIIYVKNFLIFFYKEIWKLLAKTSGRF
jgi:hypothetical protein